MTGEKISSYEITIPYKVVGVTDNAPAHAKYLTLLRDKVFPTIDHLLEKKLISNYHIILHKWPNPPREGLDLRLWLKEEDKNMVDMALKEYEIEGTLQQEGNGRSDEENEILRLATEITRQLTKLDQTKAIEQHSQAVHYLNLAFGMTNLDESYFHTRNAVGQHIQSQVEQVDKNQALQNAKKQVIGWVNGLKLKQQN